MTAQANTAGNADANTNGTGEQTTTPQADPQDTRRQESTTPTDGAQAHPQQQATPNANDEGAGDLEGQIEAAEKRKADKAAYLKQLEEELRDADREISTHKQKLKSQQGQQQTRQHPPQESAGTPDDGNRQLTDTQAEMARNLGLTGQEFLDLMRDNPDQGIAKLVEVAQRGVLEQMPQYLHQQQVVQQAQQRIARAYEDLGQEDSSLFDSAVADYQHQGFAPTPEHIVNDIRFGPPEQQGKLMEFGLAYLQERQQGQQQPQQPMQQPPGTRPHPMAPGGGSPVQPQRGNQNPGQRENKLREMNWNV